jgi:EAL domain-containing protein (putative c-di-GMP-specific phosphodiesterase class I)/CheY-like chemotaxis protein
MSEGPLAMSPITVIVADDDEGIRGWLRNLIAISYDIELVGEADSAAAAVELARMTEPDVAVIDVRMPGGGGGEGAQLIRSFSPDTRVLAFSAHDMTSEVLAMIEAGVSGYVVKSGDSREIIAAIRAAAAGSVYLSSGVDATVLTQLRETLVDGAQRALQRSRIESLIDDVVAREAIESHYQPIVDLESGEVVGYEALARIQSHRHQPPNEWFADAASVGRLDELEDLAIRAALRALPHLRPEEFLAINVAPQTALGPVLGDTLAEVPVERVVLEITEHVAVADYAELFQALYPMRARGLRVAIDDVGAGYSSMAHVLHLAPAIIKLDRTITAGIQGHGHHQFLVESMRGFAEKTGAVLLAEGIETRDELETMQALGIRLGQGYLLGYPAPLDDSMSAPAAQI